MSSSINQAVPANATPTKKNGGIMLPAKRMSDHKKRVINDDDDDEDHYEGPPKKLQKVNESADKSAGKVPEKAVPVPDEDSDSDEEGGGAKGKTKWRTLEHHGVIFFPPYKPHGVKLLHKGKPINLT